jgi:anti-sigma factor RsiW
MTSCGQQHLLEAYHDGELDADARVRFETHLQTCASCAAELDRLRAASEPLRRLRAERLSPQQLEAIHQRLEGVTAEDDSRTMRLAATMAVLAASVMLIGLAWLRVLTPAPQTPVRTISSSPPPSDRAWERVAMTLQPDPLSLPATGDQTAGLMADWMLVNLNPRIHTGQQRTEQR